MSYNGIRHQIHSGTLAEKRQAIQQLAGRNGSIATRLLIQASMDLTPEVASTALHVMATAPRSDQSRYRGAYEALVDSENAAVRRISVRQICGFRDTNALQLIRQIAVSSDEELSLIACVALVEAGLADEARTQSPYRSHDFRYEIVRALLAGGLLNEEDMTTLQNLKESGYIPILKRMGHKPADSPDPDPPTVEELLSIAVQQIDNRRRVDAFDRTVKELSTTRPHLARHLASIAIQGEMNARTIRAERHLRAAGVAIRQYLWPATEHPNAYLRGTALELLLEINDLGARDLALRMLHDPNDLVRNVAVRAVGRTDDRRALPILIERACTRVYTDSAFNEALTALEAIGELQVDHRSAFLTVYNNGNVWLRRLAAEKLAKLADSSLIDEFEKMIWNEDEPTAAYAVMGLHLIGSARCRQIIELRIDDPRELVRNRARGSFEKWRSTEG